ncbi:hypothetical protein U1Q18_052230, partial [Sarracenia purpurea var. burkii]
GCHSYFSHSPQAIDTDENGSRSWIRDQDVRFVIQIFVFESSPQTNHVKDETEEGRPRNESPKRNFEKKGGKLKSLTLNE